MCTPEGEKKYCLPHHDWHQCDTGLAPCCQDSSKPIHHHHEGQDQAPADDEVTCAAPVVLDDMDDSGTTKPTNAFPGSYAPCMKDAYNGQFHHDWSKNKGQANVSFVFDPPSDGCWKIEEYHPGADPMCRQYMPRNALLNVGFCKGLSQQFVLDQTQSPGQWNEVTRLPFYKGWKGKITVKNHKSEECDAAGHCFMMADAFRMTRVGDSCSVAVTSPTPSVVKPSASKMPDSRDGMLHLEVDVTISSDNAIPLLIQNQKAIESVLQTYLGYKLVDVMDVMHGRRLSAGGPASGTYQKVDVTFVAGGWNGRTTKTDVTPYLKAALASKGLEIKAAAVEWVGSTTAEDDFASVQVIMALGAVVALVCVVFCLVIGFSKRRGQAASSKQAWDANVINVAAQEEVDVEEARQEFEDKQEQEESVEVEKAKDVESMSVGSGSTDAPASEEGASAKEEAVAVAEDAEGQSTGTPCSGVRGVESL